MLRKAFMIFALALSFFGAAQMTERQRSHSRLPALPVAEVGEQRRSPACPMVESGSFCRSHMAFVAALIDFLRWFTLAVLCLTWMRLLRCGLHRKYRMLFAYLVFSSLRSSVLLGFPTHSGTYAKIWIVTEPVLWLFYILVVLELYSLILENHKGLYTLGRWAMYVAFAAAVAFSSLSLLAPADAVQKSRIMPFLLLTERGLLLSLLIFLFLILAFLSRYPITLTRNVIVHSVVFSVFFLSNSVAFLLRSIFGLEVARPANALLMATTAACVVAWLVLLNPKGEARKVHLNARPQAR